MNIFSAYKMAYDDIKRGDNGLEGPLGDFHIVEILMEDGWACDLLGVNPTDKDDKTIYLIHGWEVKGIGGGMASRVVPLKNLKYTGNYDEQLDSQCFKFRDEV